LLKFVFSKKEILSRN